MAIYAIGDLQGCYNDFRRLLDKCQFNPDADTLWLAGDLVNRGPNSLETLRHVVSLGDSVISVLGNHDLHMLAIDAGMKSTRDPDLIKILDAPDRPQLMHWLRQRPMIHHDPVTMYTLVHAGIYPPWNLAQAQAHAAELHAILRSENYPDFFEHMYGDQPDCWSEDLQGWDRLRFICNSFSRMRFCSQKGQLYLPAKGPPGTQAEGYHPWFSINSRKTRNQKIIFGHWSTLGTLRQHNTIALDTACIWGGKLTALQVDSDPENPRYISINCPAHREGKLE
ncbi:Bis(5'-nucleosyl)-tetraphosphatase, symmetrical [hydrothermal vent metagenome]|uniref:bis(5'-nucleosyl)-tetraphosphatase (symmetrical) n=1 Tax=hydrothermal vent metagenome TaxID=652676 RepID=A0A3B1ATE2_9ZZZZ